MNAYRSKRLFKFVIVFVCFLCVSVLFIREWSEDIRSTDNIQKNNYSNTGGNKPHLVIGILSSAANSARRNAVRNTWIATITKMKHKLPFRITYKFLVDVPTNSLIDENNMHKDIVYLNITHHGYAYKFGEKIHGWLKYIWNNFPDVSLGVKMDDDVFLCVPHILYRLSDLRSPTLYYGWKHENYKNKHITTRIDEMFVVLGRDLIQRIANRKYCGKPKCENKYELQETNYAGSSLVLWMSIYKDVELHADNTRIRHFGRGQLTYLKQFVTSFFCEDFVLFHKALPDVMTQLHRLNRYQENVLDLISPMNINTEYNRDFIQETATTGSLFSGNIVRYRTPFMPFKTQKPVERLPRFQNNLKCDNWAVVTTIQLPTKAVKNLLQDINWCIVVVADLKTPSKTDYLKSLTAGLNSKRLEFLSVKEQSSLFPLLSESIPNNSIGRKNIGFMYAIYRRAKAIWDFDDDNNGIIDLNDFGLETPATSYVKVCDTFRNKLINPYPYFGVQESLTWPRGFPLQSIKEEKTIPKVCNNTKPIKVGVIQSLANGQPDVDAIYRLTRKVPFNFSSSKNHRGLIIPKGSLSPFNAQATLWLSPAFEFMPLPISVNGRVSDIWRSYIAQYFMHKKDIKLTFVRPYVFQERNVHTLIRDFNAEKDLYEKSKQLTDFLSKPNIRSYETMQELYENLYQRNYIEMSDLRFIKSWETTFSYARMKKGNDFKHTLLHM